MHPREVERVYRRMSITKCPHCFGPHSLDHCPTWKVKG